MNKFCANETFVREASKTNYEMLCRTSRSGTPGDRTDYASSRKSTGTTLEIPFSTMVIP